jgi:hypothetical protein
MICWSSRGTLTTWGPWTSHRVEIKVHIRRAGLSSTGLPGLTSRFPLMRARTDWCLALVCERYSRPLMTTWINHRLCKLTLALESQEILSTWILDHWDIKTLHLQVGRQVFHLPVVGITKKWETATNSLLARKLTSVNLSRAPSVSASSILERCQPTRSIRSTRNTWRLTRKTKYLRVSLPITRL